MLHPLSVQLYSVRDHYAQDRAATLHRLAEIGFTAVEPFQPTDDPSGFRKIADDLGLAVSSSHAIGLVREPEPGPVFEAVAALGTDRAILPAGIVREEFTTHEGLERTAGLLNSLSEQAASFGLRIGYHNHWWEFEPVLDGRHALEILADLTTPAVFFEIDTYWAAVGGADVPAVLARLGDRVELLHVKDGPLVQAAAHVALGQGAMPIPQVLAAAPDAWRVVEFDDCDTDIFEALAVSRTYLAGLERS